MRLRRTAGLAAGLACLGLVAAAPAAVAGPTVTVRVEGQTATLLERTKVTLPDTPPPVEGCPRYTAAAAIEEGTHGNWDRQQFTSTILGETHTFQDSDYWAEWLDRGAGYKRGAGICSDVLADGDEVLMLVDRSPPPTYSPTVFPLDLEGVPAAAQRGDAVTVTVVDYYSPTGATGEGERRPVAGAAVSGGGTQATTGPDGRATLRLDQTGTVTLKATKPGDAPSAGESVQVTEQPPPAPTTTPPDTSPPVTRIEGIGEQQRFSRRRAPRMLHGTVDPDPSGVSRVELSLTRSLHGHCSRYDTARERFRRARCGRRKYFNIGDAEHWSYLLPHRLKRGRYVLDALATDGAGNRDRLARGRSRVVFFVR
jgi:hypothetical protein